MQSSIRVTWFGILFAVQACSGLPDGARSDAGAPSARPRAGAGAPGDVSRPSGPSAAQYRVRRTGPSHWTGSNRFQSWTVAFTSDGVSVTSTRRASDGTPVGLSLRSWGRLGAETDASGVDPAEGACLSTGAADAREDCLRRIEYARPSVTEWWENRPEGLEHGFTVEGRPEGDGPLVLDVAVDGARVEVRPDRKGAELTRPGGEVLAYSGLRAWDSAGRDLPATMEARPSGLALVVDDAGAVGTITVDPLLEEPAWSQEGDQAQSYFGRSVTSAGDVNGDGYGDFAIGQPYHTGDAGAQGRVELYHGTATGPSPTAAWSAEGEYGWQNLGAFVTTAGDTDGDGFGDLLVSDDYGTYLYRGSPSGLGAASEWLASTYLAVASAGDVNGDGFSDVLVGDLGWAEFSGGLVELYLGSGSGLAVSPVWTAFGVEGFSDLYGTSIAAAGDVDGDGFGDVVVGARLGGPVEEGLASMYRGTASGLEATPAWSAAGAEPLAGFGEAVTSPGDVNGDGFSDVAVSAPYADDPEDDQGRVFVYHGSATGLSGEPDWTADGDMYHDEFGRSLAPAGDVNGDGYADLVASASADGDSKAGRAEVYLGSPAGLESNPAWSLVGDQWRGELGRSVSGAGDVDGDGFGDILIATPRYYGREGFDAGRVQLFMGSGAAPAPEPGWTASGEDADASLGRAVAAAGDVDGDGYGDVIVGAPGELFDPGVAGGATLYRGSSTGLGTGAAWAATSDQEDALMGSTVSSAGDVNGDGFADVLVGAPLWSGVAPNTGAAWLYLGSEAGLSATAAWTAEGDTPQWFGSSVAAAGDVDGDGYGDVVVGASHYSSGQLTEGRVLLFRGSAAGLAQTPAWTAESDLEAAGLGHHVAAAGDVDGDGYADLLATSFGDGVIFGLGTAFLYLGSPEGPPSDADWSAPVGVIRAEDSRSAASAGDVNGDGYGDVVVGDQMWSNGELGEGKASVYLGSPAGLEITPAWTAESNFLDARFGSAVSAAGDVDGDGFGDILVGAAGHSGGEANNGAHGRVYVYLGSAAGPSAEPAWTFDSGEEDAELGSDVAPAGDVDGDGYADFLAGAPHYHSMIFGDLGRAYLFLGNGGDGTGPGRRAVSQARQVGATTPIVAGLTSASESAFDVAAVAGPGPWGRTRVKVQVEAKPLGTPFDGTDLVTSPTWTDSGLDGTVLQQEVAGLQLGTGYHWRARVLFDPAMGVVQGWGPWRYGGAPGDAQGGHVFSAGQHFVYDDDDGDGHGDSETEGMRIRTGEAQGYADDALDCDDSEPLAWSGAVEICDDGVDNDCDETLNECRFGGDVDVGFASAVFVGEDPSDTAGFSVAAAGDLNGDGFDDLAIGAYGDDSGGANAGAVYVFYGPVLGIVDLAAADAKIRGEMPGDQAGWSVSAAGDVDHDGNGDLIVGAPGHDFGGSNAGAAYVVTGPMFGGVPLAAAFKLTGEDPGDKAGSVVASAGDVDGDGYADVLVGASYDDDQGSNAGAAYLVLAPTLSLDLSAADAKLKGADAGDRAGAAVSGVGDVNGDGYGDLLVGAPSDEVGGINAGAAYLARGPAAASLVLSMATLRMTGEDAGDQAGRAVASYGDLDGDGVSDVVVGAYKDDDGGTDAGAVYVVRGTRKGNVDLSTANAKLLGVAAGDNAGASVAVAGDLNNDGLQDLLVGAPGQDGAGSDSGAVYVVYGPVTGTWSLADAEARLLGRAAGDQLGYADGGLGASRAGDVNGDGCDDLLVGAWHNDAGGNNAGAAYLLYSPCW